MDAEAKDLQADHEVPGKLVATEQPEADAKTKKAQADACARIRALLDQRNNLLTH